MFHDSVLWPTMVREKSLNILQEKHQNLSAGQLGTYYIQMSIILISRST